MTRIFMFPGQGAQSVGMGRELFDRFPAAEQEASDVLGYSLRSLCLEDPEGRLGNTLYTQPALFVVNALAHRAHLEDGGERADLALGHSLGEYNALHAAGAFGFDAGLRLVAARAAAMAGATGGGMSAVIGMPESRLRFLLLRAGFGSLDLANLNTPGQIALAGPVEDLAEAGPILEDAGARMVRRLDVSGPFHSRYMTPAADSLERVVRATVFAPLTCPVLANATARPYEQHRIAETLLQQIHQPVRWYETVEAILSGLYGPEPEFTEIGPGRVLTGMLRHIRRERETALTGAGTR
ncbi:Polyketide biosynthesis protein BaeE [Streptomyces sp. YIM 130001]|uniref:ACP S-malonyltransferase n=1 Tax=Streptomyces sp. YIM 130001 TaxID=2259644 RepID=UPI000E64E613|nr:ACP S-malonyltransferase [Streptomyces sp. YIM 130001]RII13433.1 Polyketide biosynthesis protein BaeE [Streptomyces sp. YIM 130001]